LLLGAIEETPFYVGASKYEYLRNTGLLLDVVRGEGDSFSVEAAAGARFLTRSAERPENGSVPACHARSKF
jgi:uncharacterized protein (DUF779 family)